MSLNIYVSRKSPTILSGKHCCTYTTRAPKWNFKICRGWDHGTLGQVHRRTHKQIWIGGPPKQTLTPSRHEFLTSEHALERALKSHACPWAWPAAVIKGSRPTSWDLLLFFFLLSNILRSPQPIPTEVELHGTMTTTRSCCKCKTNQPTSRKNKQSTTTYW